MAKVAYSKLKCKIDENEILVQIGEETIAVKQYLPIQEKLGLIGRVIELAHEQDANYSNPVKAEVYMIMEMIFAYTNISFTDKQKEDIAKLYDMLYSSGVMEKIFDAIPQREIDQIQSGVDDSIESVYKYQNSVLGILDTISADYSGLNYDITELQQKIADPNNLTLLKDVLTKLG